MTYKYFNLEEFACKETGENFIKPEFVERLDMLRGVCGFAFKINSGYRSPEHSAEKDKDEPGTHTEGIAADIAVTNGWQRFVIVSKAIEHGFNGIGVGKDFVHLDDRSGFGVMWVY
jgi:uncharacterized protein YcbK (DUF882 family)